MKTLCLYYTRTNTTKAAMENWRSCWMRTWRNTPTERTEVRDGLHRGVLCVCKKDQGYH